MRTDILKMEARIRGWRARIAELTGRADAAGSRASFADRQAIDDLKSKCALTQLKIDAVRTARP